MKNLDRFDDEIAREITPSDEEKAKQKSRTAQIKRGIMFFVKLFLYHFATMIFYGVAFSSIVSRDVYEDMGAAKYIIVGFSFFATILFAFIVSLELNADNDRKRIFLDIIKEQELTPVLSIKLSRPDAIMYTAIYFAFQLPMCIFHHFFGFDVLLATAFEQYFIMDIGFMELFSFGILGTIVNCILFVIPFVLFNMLTYYRWKNERITK